MTEIIDNLFVGDAGDAQSGFDGLIICVIAEKPAGEPPEALWLPLMSDNLGNLDAIAAAIDGALERDRPVLVHCGGGSERAPLAVAWFLNRRRAMPLEAAYSLLKRRRPIVKDRRAWLQGLAR